MFLGCVDNRFVVTFLKRTSRHVLIPLRVSPAAIFNAPAGSIMSHNNIGNQYSAKDPSA